MELKYLQTFQRVVQEGGFTKAAASLNYTQSTITFQIGQLEQELGVRLFDKVGRRMVLSKAGENFLPYVAEVLAALEKMQNFQADLSAGKGSLRIGAAETLLCYKLPDVVQAFHKQAPQARLFLHSMNCYDIRDALLAGKLDLGIFYADVAGFGPQLLTRDLGAYDLALVGAPETCWQFADFCTPEQELNVPFIINEPMCIFRQIFENYLRHKSIVLAHTIELWSITTIKNLLASGLGVSFLPRFAVAGDLRKGRLAEIALDRAALETPQIHAVCAWHKNKWASPLMQLFSDLCSQYLEEKL